jgi:hypothetical protein
MAISRVPGFSLLQDLDRQGTDLQFTTLGNTLVYMDFSNFYVGINNTTPSQALTVSGNVLVANGHVYTGANIQFDLGSATNYWRKLFVGNISTGDLNVSGTLTIGGNITITGNTTGGIIYADELYDSNHRVLTTNTTFTTIGDVIGSGNYSNIVLTLANTGVTSALYGSTENIPQLVINSKGQITNASNVTLTKLGNLYANNTSLYTIGGNLTFNSADGYIFASNNIISNVANPISNQDAVTLSYLNAAISATGSQIASDNSSVHVIDNGIIPGVVVTTIDGNIVANIDANSADFYVGVNIGILSIHGNTITSTGNIVIDPRGSGIVKLPGTLAVGLPSGGDATRPAYPEIGYTRFNTDRNAIETWNGTIWAGTTDFTITSDVITPDGVSNVYTLSSNASTSGVLVNINGTIQQPTTAYAIVNNNQIQFTEIPLTTDIIEVRHIAVGAVSIDSLSSGNTSIILDQVTNSIKFVTDNTEHLRINSTGATVGLTADVFVNVGNTVIIDSYDKNIYRTAKYLVQATSSLNVESYEALVTHNANASAFITVYGVINTGVVLGNISAVILGSNVQVQYAATSANTNVRLSKNYLVI